MLVEPAVDILRDLCGCTWAVTPILANLDPGAYMTAVDAVVLLIHIDVCAGEGRVHAQKENLEGAEIAEPILARGESVGHFRVKVATF
jgi:hypothetical protein